ncbi:MAG: hypothetical protein AAFR45_06835 [Pseudomonadota bacterium]
MRTFNSYVFASLMAFAPALDAASADQPVAEIVTFRLADGTDTAEFVDAALGMTGFLESTGAVLSRSLSRDENGLWTDYIVWRSMAAAKAAASDMPQQPEAADFMAPIVAESVNLRHARILMSQE